MKKENILPLLSTIDWAAAIASKTFGFLLRESWYSNFVDGSQNLCRTPHTHPSLLCGQKCEEAQGLTHAVISPCLDSFSRVELTLFQGPKATEAT